MDNEMDDVVKEFLVESHEGLDQMDQDLVALERDPARLDLLASVFRTIHTVKGTAGFLGYERLEGVTHAGETYLDGLREGTLSLSAEGTTCLLQLLDAVRGILTSIEAGGGEGNDTFEPLVARLEELTTGGTPEAAEPPVPTDQELDALFEKPTPPPPAPAPAPAPEVAAAPEPEPAPAPAPSAPEPAAAPAPTQTTRREKSDGKSLADSNIRVDVGLLDTLMNLVGELVLARNQVLQFSATQEDATFLATTQRLNLITTELQEGVMKTRMQPIGNVWSKFPRVVRDLSVACQKQVRVVMEGEDTELDKTIIEAIKDPLTHVVRNSVDHGIETPADRVARGKPAEGTLLLRAFHEGGQVNIEISDDGKGIDPEKVKAKAIERGVVTQEQASRMDQRELVSLIFRPGFSTAAAVTHISGRGVGMDVVKTNIEKIGGTVDINNRPGQGMTLKVKIPLTLAIIPALIVSSGGERFAIPQVSLLELVRLEGEQVRTSIERIHGTPVYRLRGNLLPLVYLNQALDLPDAAATEDGEESLNIVVLQADDRQFGLVVEGINDTEEIVVKPLSKILKGISAFAGATIMGDGRVALILDVLGIGQRSGLVSSRGKEASLHVEDSGTTDPGEERQALLIVGIGDRGRMAIPLSSVARLEEIPSETVEHAGDDEVVQYRGEIMPLLRLARMLGRRTPGDSAELMQVVVYSRGDRSIGMVVDRIVDVVEDSYTVQRSTRRNGLLGSAVIQGRVTDLLDLESLVRTFDPSFFEQPAAVGAGA